MYHGTMKTTVIEHLEKQGKRSEVEAELAGLGLTRRTLNDPVNRQRLITALEERFPKWRKEATDDDAK